MKVGRYTVIEPVARGGMAEILLAEATDLPGVRRVVVLKRMLPELARDEAYARMFLDEARILASLSHPNVVQIVEAGREEGELFIAMERVEGESASALIEACRARGERVPIEHAVLIVSGVLAGLHYVHEKRDEAGRPLNLVHRDVSPRNVLVTREGGVKLIDFGIARPANALGTTQAGRVKGTPAYMSPEQVRGLMVDRRTDVFSAGIVLWELIAGERLFPASNELELVRKIVDEPIPPPGERCPRAIAEVLMRALARAPAERWATAGDFHDALEAAARAEGLVGSQRALASFVQARFEERPRPASAASAALATRTAAAATSTVAPPPRRAGWVAGAGLAIAALAGGVWLASREGGPRVESLGIDASTAVEGLDATATPPVEARGRAAGGGGPLAAGATADAGAPLATGAAPAGSAPRAAGGGLDAGAAPRAAVPEGRPSGRRPAPADADTPKGGGDTTPGELVLDASPWCLVTIDGEERGPTPLITKLPPGPHEVLLRNEEFAIRRTVTVTIEPGKRTARRYDFPKP